ncbi:MAG: hypothetical protein GX303_02190 [Clostridiales bacterium]|nr:hypothetical protein [Clostridiales bacterium]
MQKKATYYSIAAFSLIVTIAFIFIRKEALAKFFEVETGFYLADASLPRVLHYGLFAVVVLYALAYLIPKLTKTAEFEMRPPSSFVVFSSAFTGFILFAFILRGVREYLKIAKDRNLLKNPKVFLIFIIILAIPAAMHFFSKITADGKQSDKRAILGLAPVFWCMSYIFVLYFDRSILINNPNKILTQLTFVAVALFLLFECRFPLGRPKSGAYLSSALIAQLLTGVNSMPNILYYFKNAEPLKISGESNSFNDFLSTFMTGSPLVQPVLFDFLTFGFFLYATARIFSLARMSNPLTGEINPAEAVEAETVAGETVAGENADELTTGEENVALSTGEVAPTENGDRASNAADPTENGDRADNAPEGSEH